MGCRLRISLWMYLSRLQRGQREFGKSRCHKLGVIVQQSPPWAASSTTSSQQGPLRASTTKLLQHIRCFLFTAPKPIGTFASEKIKECAVPRTLQQPQQPQLRIPSKSTKPLVQTLQLLNKDKHALLRGWPLTESELCPPVIIVA